MIRFTLSQLAAIAHGERQGSDVAIDEVTTDTRKVTAGCLFVALKGERFDAAGLRSPAGDCERYPAGFR